MTKTATAAIALLGLMGAILLTTSSAPAADGATKTAIERAASTPKGELKNPLQITPEIVEEGKALYQAKTCGACHGGNGGGIHCPSLLNDAWIYGSDDDTLFRLVTLGSEGLAGAGYSRGNDEKHAGPMPAFGEAIGSETDLWKIVAFIRSLKAPAAAQ